MTFAGIDFTAARDLNVCAGDAFNRFYDCTFTISGANASFDFITKINGEAIFENCTFTVNHISESFDMLPSSKLVFHDCSYTGATSPTTIFSGIQDQATIEFDSCDWSAGTNLVGDVAAVASGGTAFVRGWRSKIPANVFVSSPLNSTTRVELYGCTSGTTLYDVYIGDAYGITQDTTAIYRSGKYDGTNGYALKASTTASGKPGNIGHRIHVCDVWAAANSTITLELLTHTGVTLDESEAWLEIIQPDSTGPLGTHSHTRDANYGLGTPATLTTGAGYAAWTGGIATDNSYKLSHTVTGGAAGIHSVFLVLATSSAKDVWIDPHVDVT